MHRARVLWENGISLNSRLARELVGTVVGKSGQWLQLRMVGLSEEGLEGGFITVQPAP